MSPLPSATVGAARRRAGALRAAARARGLTYYYGTPCSRHGHLKGKRSVSTNKCPSCVWNRTNAYKGPVTQEHRALLELLSECRLDRVLKPYLAPYVYGAKGL